MPSGVGREVVACAIPSFLERYPGVKVVWSMTDRMVDLVESQIDVAIRVGKLGDSSLKARKIGESRRVVCASPDYLQRCGRPESPMDLERHNCLTWRDHPGENTWSFRCPNRTRSDHRVTGNFFARSADALVAAAVSGLGIIHLPDWNMGIELRQGQLETVLDRYRAIPATSPIWAVHGHASHPPPKVQAFVGHLVQRFRENGLTDSAKKGV